MATGLYMASPGTLGLPDYGATPVTGDRTSPVTPDTTIRRVGTTPIPGQGINTRTPGRTPYPGEQPLQRVTPNVIHNMIGDFSLWNLLILGLLVYIAFRLLKIKGI